MKNITYIYGADIFIQIYLNSADIFRVRNAVSNMIVFSTRYIFATTLKLQSSDWLLVAHGRGKTNFFSTHSYYFDKRTVDVHYRLYAFDRL